MLEQVLSLPKELYHPLIIHFPIALWITGAVLYLISQMSRLRWLRSPALVAGVLGSALGWVAVQTGEMASKVVGPALCNAALLNAHERHGETALLFLSASFGGAALVQFVVNRFSSGNDVPAFLRWVVCVGLVLGTVYLTLTGHKGFQMVYHEGVGVRTAVSSCAR